MNEISKQQLPVHILLSLYEEKFIAGPIIGILSNSQIQTVNEALNLTKLELNFKGVYEPTSTLLKETYYTDKSSVFNADSFGLYVSIGRLIVETYNKNFAKNQYEKLDKGKILKTITNYLSKLSIK